MNALAFMRGLALALALCAWLPASAQTPHTPLPAQALVVTASVNGQTRGDFFVMRRGSDDWLVREEDLARLGLAVPAPQTVQLDGLPHVRLAELAGLAVRLDARTLTLELTAPLHWLPRSVLAAPPTGLPPLAFTGGRSAFLNWAVEGEAASGAATASRLSVEAGGRDGALLVLSRGHTVRQADGTAAFVRLDTSATYDLVEHGARVQLGDLFTHPPALGTSLLVGGLSVSRLSSLDPFQIRHPLGSVQGQASLPSDVEVYVNGQRVRSTRVSPGEFELQDLLTPQGAGELRLVVRDPYGREQVFERSLYTSDRLLRPGLQAYHYALGAVRRAYGLRSFDYGAPAATAHHRWGVSDGLTLGLDASARRRVVNAGASATLSLGRVGVLSASVAASRAAAADGLATTLRYDYLAPRWSLALAWRRDSAGYAPVAERLAFSGLREESYLYASTRLGTLGSLWLARSFRRAHPAADLPEASGFSATTRSDRGQLAIGHVTALPGRAGTLRTSVSRSLAGPGPRQTELSVALALFLDSRQLLATGARAGGAGHGTSLQWTRTPPPAAGWGFDLAAQSDSFQSERTLSWRAAAQLNADAVRLRGELERAQGGFIASDRLRLSAAGGLAWLNGAVRFGRPVEGAFALVKVGDLAGVPVRVNGSPVGVTDAAGELFVPEVGAWWEHHFSIDAHSIPLEWGLPRLARRAMLPERAGAVIDFELARRTALLARLLAPGPGGPQPLQRATFRLDVDDGGQAGPRQIESATGLQGELYLENVPPGTHRGTASTASGECRFTLRVPADIAVMHDAGDLPCEP
ncbi:fimbria/pilus outer membrane usher protein [Ramlibacter rhizophilus]|uniref:Fimbrial biogenesis outer membrane usher protein n=1 Tax=Ramlibacter rhizophilus TaxID=1781167 RepID=A0A4Z0BDG5_9BURK|nr:fimbria/pilus outer membrane usher protein [Ramlibacter rhizophilus]TFY97355.1 fimbrial biogenesis outer membrane usher protein [Ramlibacter rhizophilus]